MSRPRLLLLDEPSLGLAPLLVEQVFVNGINPQLYITALLTRLVNGWPEKRIDELMPWHWLPKQPP
jgi:hypothetical protein